MSDWYWQILKRLPTDYKEYGGEIDPFKYLQYYRIYSIITQQY